MLWRIVLFVPLVAPGVGRACAAKPLAPPPPPVYDVQIRYQIEANRNERVAQATRCCVTFVRWFYPQS